MLGEKKGAAKTMTLSLRLDPKTRFILEFMARIKGQSITTVVERAIKEAADGLRIGPQYDEQGNVDYEPTWADFWDASEGVRTLRLLNNPAYPTTFDEETLGRSRSRTRRFSTTSVVPSRTAPTSMPSGRRSRPTRRCGGKRSAATTGRPARR